MPLQHIFLVARILSKYLYLWIHMSLFISLKNFHLQTLPFSGCVNSKWFLLFKLNFFVFIELYDGMESWIKWSRFFARDIKTLITSNIKLKQLLSYNCLIIREKVLMTSPPWKRLLIIKCFKKLLRERFIKILNCLREMKFGKKSTKNIWLLTTYRIPTPVITSYQHTKAQSPTWGSNRCLIL